MAQASEEKLEQIEPAKKERAISAPQNSVISPDYKVVRLERAKVSESRTLARKRRVRAGAWRKSAPQ